MRPNFAKVDATHTGVLKTNSSILTLVIPPDGTYVTSAPFLMTETTKDEFLVEIQFIQGGNLGHKFRCEIGQPTVRDDKDLGYIIEIPMVAMEFIGKEHYDSFQDVLTPPQQRFINLVNGFNNQQGANGTKYGFLGGSPTTAIDLPGSEKLKQNWLPLAPTRNGVLMEEVIDRLSQAPPLGGVLRDFYFDFIPSNSVTRQTDVFAEEFGEQDSGVVLSPLTLGQVGAESGKTFNLDNLQFKNLVLLKGDPNCGSLPTAHQVFASKQQKGQARDIYDSGTTYEEGDVVRRNFPGSFPDQRYFTSLVNGNLNNTPESNLGSDWFEDFTIDPSVTVTTAGQQAYFTYTPWTEDLDNYLTNLADILIPPPGYIGMMPDWNVSRFNFDRKISDDNFERISVKLVYGRFNSPPAASTLWQGKRFIVGQVLSTDGSIGGAWAPGSVNRGRIAEVVGDPSGSFTWAFSDLPVDSVSGGSDRIQDVTNDFSAGFVQKWDATANGGNGDWIFDWVVNLNADVSAPWHPVRSIIKVPGATGIPDQGLQLRYDWMLFSGGAQSPIYTSPTGDPLNAASRGAWLSYYFPFPLVATGSGPIGHQYGQNREFPYLDAHNLTRSHLGNPGWNNGEESEDLGAISACRFNLKLGLYKSTDDSEVVLGTANIPMIFWALDKFDRIFFTEFFHKVNGTWETHTIPFGPRAGKSMYNSRIDQLISFFNHKLPLFDFFLKEREFTGVDFDWRFVKSFGIFMKQTYSDTGLYQGNFLPILQQITEFFTQLYHNGAEFLSNLFLGNPQPPSSEFVTDHATIAIDELYFVKELYVTSDKTPNDDPRIILERDETQVDYSDATAKALAIETRKQFYPQFWFIRARGDVRLKLGQRFKVAGPRVPGPGNELELVCSQVKHTIDTNGYFMEVFGVRKFEL